jgi:N-acetylneuraminic acid mutarotase
MSSLSRFLMLMIFLLVAHQTWAQYAWEQKSSLPASGRHRASSCAIGNRGYVGLGHYNSTGEVVFNDWWEFDPGSNAWTQKANLPASPRFGAVALGIGNYGYIIQGNDGNINLSDSWKYDPASNSWSAIANFPGAAGGKASGAVVNGKAYVGNSEATNAWHVYDPILNSWNPCANFPGPQRNFSSIFTLNSKIYLGTGITFNYTTMYNDFWCYDPALNTWTAKANFPGSVRYCTQGFSVNGKGYLGLGYSTVTTNNFDEIYEYNDVTNSWSVAPNFLGSARRLTTAFVLNNIAYVATGTNGTNFNDLWAFNPMVAVEEFSRNEIRIYPNPATEYFVIECKEQITNGTLTIYDVVGNVIREEIVSGDVIRIDCDEMKAGVYFVSVLDRGRNVVRTRITIL